MARISQYQNGKISQDRAQVCSLKKKYLTFKCFIWNVDYYHSNSAVFNIIQTVQEL